MEHDQLWDNYFPKWPTLDYSSTRIMKLPLKNVQPFTFDKLKQGDKICTNINENGVTKVD